ncbi:MAG: DUF6029 family protein [Flavobacteriaceae bacterium]
MKKIILFFILVQPLSSIYSQIIDGLSVGFESNSAWYNDDKKTGAFNDQINNDQDKHLRINNYLKFDYNFLSKFTASVQVESYEPFALLNYSTNLNGTNLGTYSLMYNSQKINATVGHFYEQFGSGMILRNWEDRQLGINNSLFGSKINYRLLDFANLTAIYGAQRVGFKTSDAKIFGFNSEFQLDSVFKWNDTVLCVGFSYVGREQDIDFETPNFEALTNAYSVRLDYSHGNIYSSAEYVLKSNDAVVQSNQISNEFIKPGSGFLFNAGYSKKGFGLDATFRRLENMSFSSDRKNSGNVFFENVINYTPGLTKQHDYLLTNIFVYQAQSSVSFLDPELMVAGEIGGQIDLFYNIKKETVFGGKYGTKIAFNASYWAGLKGDFSYTNQDYNTKMFGFGDKYFSDISLEVRKKWSSKWNSIFYVVNQFYNKKYIEGNFGAKPINANIVVLESTYKLGNGKSVRLEGQKLWSDSKSHDWTGGTLEFNFNSKFSIYINNIYNSGDDPSTENTHYYNAGGSLTKGATRIALNYGRQRAGLICVGGVCRFVPEATGLTASITIAF